jgi:hypothetical protein
MPKIHAGSITINYDQIKTVVQGWRLMAKALNSVQGMVIQGISRTA